MTILPERATVKTHCFYGAPADCVAGAPTWDITAVFWAISLMSPVGNGSIQMSLCLVD